MRLPTTHQARAGAIEASMRKAFTDAWRDLPADDLLASAAAFAAAWSDLDDAISSSRHDNREVHPVLCIYAAALREAADPELIRQRLLQDADRADASADKHDGWAREFADKAEKRRADGWPRIDVEEFENRAGAGGRCAAEARSRAAELRRRAQRVRSKARAA